MNKYTKPFHNGISTLQQRQPKKAMPRVKYLYDKPKINKVWFLDDDVSHAYLSQIQVMNRGLRQGQIHIAGSYGGGSSWVTNWVNLNLNGNEKKYQNPFKST